MSSDNIAPGTYGARVEVSALIRGRPCAVMAWFAPAEPEVGIQRPSFVAALAVDPDGEVYENLSQGELEPLLPSLRDRAERILEAQC